VAKKMEKSMTEGADPMLKQLEESVGEVVKNYFIIFAQKRYPKITFSRVEEIIIIFFNYCVKFLILISSIGFLVPVLLFAFVGLKKRLSEP
jgi:hypothetical protein